MRATRTAAGFMARAMMITLVVTLATQPGSAGDTALPQNSGSKAQDASPMNASPKDRLPNDTSSQRAELVAPGTVAAYDCATEAIGMDFTPFKKTSGTIRLTLTRKAADAPADPAPNAPAGTWRVSDNGETHVASIAKLPKQACAPDCPLTLSVKGEAMLWSPAPRSLDKLGEGELLTIAVMKPEPLSVSISTFRGRDIVALEKGACLRVEPSSP